jgi:branched-chain amino acid transport system ATP-binding protein/branched-chain amino acid transport system permease protein
VIASDSPAVIQNDPRVIEAYFGTSPERGETAA